MIPLLLLACARPPEDPRAEIRAHVGTPGPAATPPEDALLAGRAVEACLGAKGRVVAPEADEEDWRLLLRAAARAKGCISEEDGDALAAWGALGAEAERWRGPRAEWMASRGDVEGALALLATPGHDDARLRVAMAAGKGDLAKEAAEGALLLHPTDVLACRHVAQDALVAGDLLVALEAADCGGARSPELRRLRGDALDRAGETSEAEAAYREAGATVHLAALLYQEPSSQEGGTPERVAEARALLAGDPAPPAALHRVWLALMQGEAPSLRGLDQSVEATVARGAALPRDADAAFLSAVDAVPGAPAAVVRARLAAARGDRKGMEVALDRALAADPAAEPVHRARVALRLEAGGDVKGALDAWAAQDPDHVRLRGSRGPRDLPWAAIAPWTWAELAPRCGDPRCGEGAPAGADAVGAAWRDALVRPEWTDRLDALAKLQADRPELERLPAERLRVGAPSP